jgi:surfactin synthase thioesterase subunit
VRVPARETPDRSSRWFIFPHPAEADVTLFCLPHSGGGATAYRGWLTALSPTVAVRPLQPPGRESRLDEPPELDVAEIADVVSGEPRPFAIYGHSLGALLAFEVTRELYRRGGRLPERLFLGACRPPWEADREASALLALSDDEFVDALIAIGGTPREIRDQPALLGLLLRVLRSDFGWMARYAYTPEPEIPVPVVAFAAEEDGLASATAMAGWSRVTSAGFVLHNVPGGHFFAQQQVDRVTRHVANEWPSAR